MVSLQVTGAPLRTDASPRGIISFEFAGQLSLAQRMVESWGQKGQVYAGLNLGLDYLFLVVYACAIALGCVLVARGFLQRIEFLSNLLKLVVISAHIYYQIDSLTLSFLSGLRDIQKQVLGRHKLEFTFACKRFYLRTYKNGFS